MKIGIDISQVVYEGTGVARYTRNLINAILTYDKKNSYVFFFSSLRRHLSEDLKKKITDNHKLVEFRLPPTILDIIWNRLHFFSIDKLIGKCDVFISSDWTQPPVKSSTKSMTVVHDLVYIKYPQTLHPQIVAVQKRRMDWVKKELALIIADSNATKQDLIELLKIPEKKIKVIYPAVEFDSSLTTNYHLPTTNRYILSVGKLEPRKNIPRLIEAFIKADLKDTDLLIVGPKGWENKKFQISNFKFQIPKNVKFLGFVPDTDLYALYKNALLFVYPSLYEGFGYPVVEAMSLGCPVATSDTSSLKEIAEGNELLFNPLSIEEITNALVQLAGDEKLRKELSVKGKKRAEDFTLKKFADKFMKIFSL